jgi:hypothetical protein
MKEDEHGGQAKEGSQGFGDGPNVSPIWQSNRAGALGAMSVVAMKPCSYCGRENEDAALRCLECGKEIIPVLGQFDAEVIVSGRPSMSLKMPLLFLALPFILTLPVIFFAGSLLLCSLPLSAVCFVISAVMLVSRVSNSFKARLALVSAVILALASLFLLFCLVMNGFVGLDR